MEAEGGKLKAAGGAKGGVGGPGGGRAQSTERELRELAGGHQQPPVAFTS